MVELIRGAGGLAGVDDIDNDVRRVSSCSVEPRMSAQARLAKLPRESLTEDQLEVYDAIVSGPRGRGPQVSPLVDEEGGLEGPFNAFLLQPRLGSALQALGAAVRYETSLSPRAREVATLVVANRCDSAFERHAHEALGRMAGLTDDDLAALRERRYSSLPEDEALIAGVADALVDEGDLDDERYRSAAAALGTAGIFELATLVGYYMALALQLRVFRVEPSAG